VRGRRRSLRGLEGAREHVADGRRRIADTEELSALLAAAQVAGLSISSARR